MKQTETITVISHTIIYLFLYLSSFSCLRQYELFREGFPGDVKGYTNKYEKYKILSNIDAIFLMLRKIT